MCGPESLWLAARLCGEEVTVERPAKLAGTDPSIGTSAAGMVTAAKEIGLEAEVISGDLAAVARDHRQAIVIVNGNTHYSLLVDCGPTSVTTADGSGLREMSREEFEKRWGGMAIMVGVPGGLSRWSWWAVAGIVAGLALFLYCRRRRSRDAFGRCS